VDVDKTSLNVTAENIEKAISPKTKAIMVAHALGFPFPVKEIRKIADKHKLWLIEDSCDALGAEYAGKNIGSYGDISTISFFPAHQITTGEGGAILTNNALLYRLINQFRDWGRDCWCKPGEDNTCHKRFSWRFPGLPEDYDHKYVFSEVGYNMKMTEMQAAIGIEQLKKLPLFVKKRRENFTKLLQSFKKHNSFFYQIKLEDQVLFSPFGYVFLIKESAGFSRKEMIQYLEERGIATRVIFGGNLLRQPAYSDIAHRVVGPLNNSDYLMGYAFWIAVHPSLTEQELGHIMKTVDDFVTQHQPPSTK
jgi:CDP-6-deoxy-D-xylo-4-hexulose-3-dehydrase